MSKIINKTSQKRIRQKLRNNMPKPEQVLWCFLRKKQLGGIKFRRQVSIGSYIVDFYSFEKKLVIEVDGDSHFLTDKAIEYDKNRTNFLEKQGITVLRFYNTDIIQNTEECVMEILNFLGKEFVDTPLNLPCKGRN